MKVVVDGGEQMKVEHCIADWGITNKDDIRKVYALKVGESLWIYIRDIDSEIEVTRVQ